MRPPILMLSLIETLYPFLEIIVAILNFISIIVLLLGVGKVVVDIFKTEFTSKSRKEVAQHNNFIKGYFGSYVLLSLEILIAADIMESILNPTLVDIARLGAIVIIRTLISYFLNLEVKETMEKELL